MPRYSGRSLLVSFDAKISEMDKSLVAVSHEISKLEGEIAEANYRREGGYLALADFYCKDPQKIGSKFSEINRKLQTIFDEKSQRRAVVNGELSEAANLTATLREQLKSIEAEVSAAVTQIEILALSVNRELAADADYVRLSTAHAEARTATEQLQKAFEEIVAETSAKLAPYRNNRVFSYLVSCGHGTPRAPGNSLVRRIDEWAARLVAWEDHFPSYQILSELPDFAKRRLNEAKEQERFLAARLALRVHQAEASQGAEKTKQDHARLVHTTDEIRKKIAEIDQHASVLMDERRALDCAQDPFAIKAKAEIKAFLATETLQQLKARAERSAEPQDDECVAKIEQAEQIINEGRRRVKQLIDDRSAFELQRRRALVAQRKFSKEYAGRYDYFDDGFDFNALFLGYILGQHTENVFWTNLDRSYYDDTPRHAYASSSDSSGSGAWFSSSSSSGTDFSSSSSSFGGDSSGGFSSGGGDSGSSFSTGGGD